MENLPQFFDSRISGRNKRTLQRLPMQVTLITS